MYFVLTLAVVRIGFALEVYNYFEPEFEQLFLNVTLVKDNNQVSEQTFRVGIVATDPPGITPATLDDGTVSSYDYRISTYGVTFRSLVFLYTVPSVTFSFILNGDDLSEGLEGFLLTSSVVEGFP